MSDPKSDKGHRGPLEQLNQERIDEVPDWIWEFDSDGVIVYSNRVVEWLLGYSVSEVVGTPVFNLLIPEDKDKCRALFEQAKSGEPLKSVTGRFRSKNGVTRTLELSCVPMLSGNGRIAGFRSIARDVSDTLELKRAAGEALDNYKAALDNAPTGITIVQNGQAVYANPRILELMEYSQDEADEFDVLAAVHPDDRSRVTEYYLGRMRGEHLPSQYELRVITKSGKVRYFELRATLIQFNGAPAVLDNVIDVTDRKLSEQALAESIRMLKMVMDTIPVRVFWKDREHRFVGCNPPFAADAGLSSPEEIIGKTDFDMPWSEQAACYVADDRVVMETGQPKVDYEEPQTTPSGETIWLRTSKIPLKDPSGEVVGVMGTYEDITERKRAEEHRRALERHMEAQKRQFYRETILSVTNGKLDICEAALVRAYVSRARLKMAARTAADVGTIRHQIGEFCKQRGLSGERLEMFLVGAGEAVTNAIKHATAGRVYAGESDGMVWVAVADEGPGISSLILPRATLFRGFSTKPSLGLGYSIMLEVADHILLKTGTHGTTVVLEKALAEPTVSPLLDAWEKLD